MLSLHAGGVCCRVAAALLSAAGGAIAQVDVTKSTIMAVSKQMNVPVEGKFNKFSADVKFDPASRPTAARSSAST